MRLLQTILPILLFLQAIVYAQTPWRIDRLGIEEGLSEGYVYAIHQDKKGFIWIATHGGLNRYDGYGFKVFQYRPFDSSSLGDNSIFFIAEDPLTGKFWVGGSSCLNEFDPETFVNRRHKNNSEQLEFADGIFVNNEELLLACQNKVLLFNTKRKIFNDVPVFDESERPVEISRIENTASDRQGNFMILSKSGIFFYDPVTRSCKRKTGTSPDLSPLYQYEVFNLLQDGRGNYWIATNKKGLIHYQPSSKKTTVLDLPLSLHNESIRFDAVKEDSKGFIWAGSTNGLFRIDPLHLRYDYFSCGQQKNFLSHPEINVICEDRNRFIWVGTVGGGVNKLIPQNAGFKNILLSQENSTSSTGTYIMAMQQFKDDIWFVNIWDQVGKVNLHSGKMHLLDKSVLPSSYSWYSEGAMLKSKNGHPILLNGENSYEIEPLHNGTTRLTSKPSAGLFHLHYARNGKVFFFVKKAIDKLELKNDTLYGNQFFYDSEEDNHGNIWIGTSKGLVRLNPNRRSIDQYRHNDNDPLSISSDFIYALEIDKDFSNIWMAAYSGGLCSYNIASNRFRHYNKEDGLADNIVYSIEKDQQDNLWFSTNAGISTYQVKTNTFRNYGRADGLLNSEFNRQSSARNEDGWLFFGGIFGIDYFHPDSISKSGTTGSLVFTNFKIFDKDYTGIGTGSSPTLLLKHSDRFVTIEFAALDYYDQQKIQYAYRIDQKSDWITIGNQHTLSFSDLSSGSHHLEIRSTNAEGVWLNNTIHCIISIQPAWWQTNWFRALVAGLILITGVAVVRTYYGRKLQKQKLLFEKQQAVERERTRIATDMHDDLGAGLTRIKFISENILEHSGSREMQTDVEKLKSSSNELVEKMGEIIWAMNEKNNSLEDLLFYLRSYTADYCSENHLSCEFDIPQFIPMITIDGHTRRNIFLILKESLHNIVKHAAASKVEVKVQIDKQVRLIIRDNGRGFTSQPGQGNGLINMQRRAKDLNGTLTFTSDEHTTVQLIIPLP